MNPWWIVYIVGGLITLTWAIGTAWKNPNDVKQFGWDAIIVGSIFITLLWPAFWVLALI